MSKLNEANKYFFGTENTAEVKKLFESDTKPEKLYIYYGTEENGYELQKSETKNFEKDLSEILENGFDKKEVKELVQEAKEGLDSEGMYYVEFDSDQGYNIFVGVAKKSKGNELRDMLKDMRKEFISMF